MARPRAAAARSKSAARPAPAAAATPLLGPWAEGLALGLLFVALMLLHGGGLARPFFADDYLFLEQVRGRGLFEALATPDPIGNFMRPVSRALWFWTVGRLFGETPLAFHLANLLLFLGALAVLYALLRRMLGVRAAFLGLAFVSLHYAMDVPLRWASGSQDLLAALFGTLAIFLHLRGRTWLAAVALALALLSKEVAAGVVLVAILASHDPGRGWRDTLRRGAALIGVTIGWAALLAWSLASRPVAAKALALKPDHLPAAIAHLGQVAVGFEPRVGGEALGHWNVAALVPAVLAVAAFVAILAAPRGAKVPRAQADGARRRALLVGGAWVLAGTLPLVPVMPIWSAYFYLWPLFGLAMVVAALAGALPKLAGFAVVAVLITLSGGTRQLDEFAITDGAWAWQSHVNRRYVDRALAQIENYLESMKTARPTLPHRSTVFFANVIGSSGWQTADGPLIRWAYQDSTLRSYFLGQFKREVAERGPIFFFRGEGGRLVDSSDDPELMFSFGLTLLITNKDAQAADVFETTKPSVNEPRRFYYCRAWTRWIAGDTLGSRADLAAAGFKVSAQLPPDAEARVFAAGATIAARVNQLREFRDVAPLNPWVHEHLTALLYETEFKDECVIEAYAYRALVPDEPQAWRAWASAQLGKLQNEAAIATLTRYLAMVAQRGGRDEAAEEALKQARRRVHGDIAARALRAGGTTADPRVTP